jgi:Spy/CpxP family protein refolding chaperone
MFCFNYVASIIDALAAMVELVVGAGVGNEAANKNANEQENITQRTPRHRGHRGIELR